MAPRRSLRLVPVLLLTLLTSPASGQTPADPSQEALSLVGHDGEILYTASGWSTRIEKEIGKKVTSAIQAAKGSKAN